MNSCISFAKKSHVTHSNIYSFGYQSSYLLSLKTFFLIVYRIFDITNIYPERILLKTVP